MPSLLIDVGQAGDKLNGGGNAGPAYAEVLTIGLSVTYVFDPTSREENCIFTGPQDALDTIVWRFVTPLDMVMKGEYLTEATADATEREEFEHFLNLV